MVQVAFENFVNRVLTSQDRVGFMQVDSYNHMNSARYVEMAINHRGFASEDQAQIFAYELGKQLGIAMVIQNLNINYLSPSLLHEQLEIASWINDFQQDGFSIRVLMSGLESRRVKAALTIAFRIVDIRSGKLTELPKVWPSRAEQDPSVGLPLAVDYVTTVRGVPPEWAVQS